MAFRAVERETQLIRFSGGTQQAVATEKLSQLDSLKVRFCQTGSALTIFNVISFDRVVIVEVPDRLAESRTSTPVQSILCPVCPGARVK